MLLNIQLEYDEDEGENIQWVADAFAQVIGEQLGTIHVAVYHGTVSTLITRDGPLAEWSLNEQA